MGDLINELHVIWIKYEPQRKADDDAARTRAEAQQELHKLNMKRIKLGLETVSEYRETSLTQGSNVMWSTSGTKTWRDEMDAELLATVKRFLQSLSNAIPSGG
jgi:hypothetical protein